MCLLFTLAAALTVSLLWLRRSAVRRAGLGTLALFYWGAGLMWLVDGIFAMSAGEPFLSLSADDAALGILVVLCGLGAWALLRHRKRAPHRRNSE